MNPEPTVTYPRIKVDLNATGRINDQTAGVQSG